MSKAEQYWVDWEDSDYPQIRHIKFAPVMDGEVTETPQTLAGCKRDIIEHFQAQLDHARNRIRDARTLRKEDILS